MSAVIQPVVVSEYPATLQFSPMAESDLDEVIEIENTVYAQPWTRGNFVDALRSDYQNWVLRDTDGLLLGYFLLMLAVDEAHLLNISVRRELHRRGLGRQLLAKVVALADANVMSSVLLEVRPTNTRALCIYRRYGFIPIGQRRNYYPPVHGLREDAIVMRLSL